VETERERKMNNIIKFPKKKLKRKYAKKKRYVIAIVPRFRPALHFGSFGIEDTKKEAKDLQRHLLKEYKRPETLFHFIKIPTNVGWKYRDIYKYVDKQIKRKKKSSNSK
tara:strand:- start:209 stop:535 length:327 start_codon:yes stop_codon:yes gene_type:complete